MYLARICPKLLPLLLLAFTSAELSAETVVIRDTLQETTIGKQVGGTLGADGFSPGVGTNHILYELPRPVREGFVEVEVYGMDPTRIPEGAAHGFLGMYDGRGVDEPAEYFRDLKRNFFRWNLQWRNSRKVGMKCVISCAAPIAERLNATVAQFENDQRDWSGEPMGRKFEWNPNQWHTLRIEWRDKHFRAFVDGTEVWHATGPHDYAPIDHRLWIGCAPSNGLKYSSVLENIRYRNLIVGSFESAAN